MCKKMFVFLVLLNLLFFTGFSESLNDKKFPAGFNIGVSTSAYQIEGGWNADGKGLSIWDVITHKQPSSIKDNSTGDIACDSYHKYEEDVALLKDLGVDHYRFSISWTRLLPEGTINNVNPNGVAYYKNLINQLKLVGIEPVVTLHHWDVPYSIQKLGGWPNEMIIDHFIDFVTLCFELFGDDVKTWITFNEPSMLCSEIYPKITNTTGNIEYLCAHNLIKAHAKAYRVYDQFYRKTQKGRIGIVLTSDWIEPATESEEDLSAALREREFTVGWYAHPIFFGNYPQIMIDRVAERSIQEGYSKSRLPAFSQKEIDYIKGTIDFLGLNHYTTHYAKFKEDVFNNVSYKNDVGTENFQDDDWEESGLPSYRVVPWGYRKLLAWVSETYNNTEIFITENGYASSGEELDNPRRLNFYKEYLSSVLDAIYEDGANITAYTVWSLLDNFEWDNGYTVKFGLVHVDFNDPARTRTRKESFSYLKQVIETHCLVEQCEE